MACARWYHGHVDSHDGKEMGDIVTHAVMNHVTQRMSICLKKHHIGHTEPKSCCRNFELVLTMKPSSDCRASYGRLLFPVISVHILSTSHVLSSRPKHPRNNTLEKPPVQSVRSPIKEPLAGGMRYEDCLNITLSR